MHAVPVHRHETRGQVLRHHGPEPTAGLPEHAPFESVYIGEEAAAGVGPSGQYGYCGPYRWCSVWAIPETRRVCRSSGSRIRPSTVAAPSWTLPRLSNS